MGTPYDPIYDHFCVFLTILPTPILKSKGNASLFSNFVWQRKCSQFLKLCLADGYADATYLRLVLKSKGNARHFVFLKYFWRTDLRATGGADPNATRNWCFVGADGVYFYCFSMIVHGFAEATTDTI